jgi:hypothetical protein
MLARMVEIDDLHSLRKVLGHQSPDPFGTIADDHLFFCAPPTSF